VAWRRQAAIVRGGTSSSSLKADAAEETARICTDMILFVRYPFVQYFMCYGVRTLYHSNLATHTTQDWSVGSARCVFATL
jgi:hypothetical protein